MIILLDYVDIDISSLEEQPRASISSALAAMTRHLDKRAERKKGLFGLTVERNTVHPGKEGMASVRCRIVWAQKAGEMSAGVFMPFPSKVFIFSVTQCVCVHTHA